MWQETPATREGEKGSFKILNGELTRNSWVVTVNSFYTNREVLF